MIPHFKDAQCFLWESVTSVGDRHSNATVERNPLTQDDLRITTAAVGLRKNRMSSPQILE